MSHTAAGHGTETGAIGYQRQPKASKGCKPGCACPVCQGLHTFVRPRFFAGQLLTETELTALSTYVVDKQRLHNRYLHGYGVACGLQVECDGCGPGVVVRPGYAIDPCGSDIVVPDAVSIDVLDLIARCARPDRADDCDPPRYPKATGCDDDEQVWCLWVRYKEQEARPVTPLGGSAASSTCGCGSRSTSGCGCGGTKASASASSGCGCGGSKAATSTASRSTTCGCAQAPRQSGRPADCEPSRIHEYVEFGVAPRDASCSDLGSVLGGTFPAKVVECVTHLRPLLTKGMTKNMQASSLSLLTGGQVGLAGVGRDSVCQLYANVVELYRNDPMRTQCVLPEQLSTIDCSPQGPNETDDQFRVRLSLGLQQLVMLVLLYLRDCVCYAALPPCPPGVCDDRVVLACVTVRKGVVVEICNHACRKYAGSFVNREYWLPIGPVLSLLAAKLCCFPLVLPSIGLATHETDLTHRRATPFAAVGRFDNLMSAIRSDDFALAKLWQQRAATFTRKLRVASVLGSVERQLEEARGSVRLAGLLHRDAAEASEKLKEKGVQVSLVEVTDATEGLAFDAVPLVREGGKAVLYTRGGVVVGVRGDHHLSFRKAPR